MGTGRTNPDQCRPPVARGQCDAEDDEGWPGWSPDLQAQAFPLPVGLSKRNVRTFYLLGWNFYSISSGQGQALGIGWMEGQWRTTRLRSALPEDYEFLHALLSAGARSMPKRLKQLAAFALEHPEDMAFGTVAEIAEHAGVQPSTLVRFAKSLGYDGFSHLQQLFRDRLRERFPDYRERLQGLRAAEGITVHAASLLDGSLGAAARLARADAQLGATVRNCRAPSRCSPGRTPSTCSARGACSRSSAYCAYAFGKLGIRAMLIDHVAQLGPEQLGTATEPRRGARRSASRPMRRSPRNSPRWRRGGTCLWSRSPIWPSARWSHDADVWLEVAEVGFRRFPLPFRILRAGDGARCRHGGEIARRRDAARRTSDPHGLAALRRFRRGIGETLRHQPVPAGRLAGLAGLRPHRGTPQVRPDRHPHSARGRSPAPDRR